MSGPVTVREALPHLAKWGAQLVAGESGQNRSVSWASIMRTQLPAFQDLRRGELAIFSLATVQALQDRGATTSLSEVIDRIVELGASGAVIAGLTPASALPRTLVNAVRDLRARADRLSLPIIALPQQAPLADVRAAIITLTAERRDRQPSPPDPVDAYAIQVRASLRSEALETLLVGSYVGEAQMRLHAQRLGYDLNQPHVVLWVQLHSATARSGGRQHDHHIFESRDGARDLPHDQLATTLASTLAEALEVSLGAWTLVREPDDVIALAPLEDDHAQQELTDRVATLLSRTLGDARNGQEWSAGLGEPATAPAQVHRSAQEAHDAAQLGAFVLGPRHIARPTDLGIYRLLLTLREHDALAPFTARALGPLLHHQRQGDTLIETLETFFACNGNSSKAAVKLHLHRNTLLYRLKQARELLGEDLDDPEVRLTLQLAIKGRRVLALTEERDAHVSS